MYHRREADFMLMAGAMPNRTASARGLGGHPPLSAAEREHLAQRISSADGVTLAVAHVQINDFRSTFLPPTPALRNENE